MTRLFPISRGALCAAILFTSALAARALINPNYTPVHLVAQSHTIIELAFAGADEKGVLTAEVKAVLKGKAADLPKAYRIDPSAAIAEGQRAAFAGAAAVKGQRALMFIGQFQPAGFEGGDLELGGGDGGNGPKALAFLHMDGLPAAQWLVLEQWEDGLWDFVKSENFLLATFNGGTDMLRRMVEYVVADPEADVPVEAGVRWDDPPVRVGRAEGAVATAAAVWFRPEAPDLFVASPAGDRLFRGKDGALADVTDAVKLGSKSALFAWGDFDGDGRLDLASFDGQALVLHRQQADGTFAAQPLPKPEAGVRSLDALAAGGPGSALVIGTTAAPLRMVFKDGAAAVAPLAPAADGVAFPAGLTKCLVADFDNDGLADVLQPGAESGLLYRGEAPDRFAAARAVPVAVGAGGHGLALGDFDQDGRMDIFVAAERRHLLWHNRGEDRFEEQMMLSGEVSYKMTSDGVIAEVEDYNNDGRPDLLIAFSAPQPPYILYNRGFRSFAHALDLDLEKEQRLPQIAEGQQAICFGDFDGNGASDLAVVLKNGEVWLVRRAVDGGPALKIRATLPAGETGPVAVTAVRFERPLGARRAAAGQPALFGARHPGPLVLTWRYPGAAAKQKEVVLENQSVNVVLDR